MKKIKAIFNVGRWIWVCPDCGAGNLIKPDNEMAFCGDAHCYPDKFAIKEAIINNTISRNFDKKKQDEAKKKAWSEGRVYKIVFPGNHKEIVEFLRPRKTEHMSWEVDQTIADLEFENKHHPLLKYLKKPKIERITAIVVPHEVIELPEIDDKTLGRIM